MEWDKNSFPCPPPPPMPPPPSAREEEAIPTLLARSISRCRSSAGAWMSLHQLHYNTQHTHTHTHKHTLTQRVFSEALCMCIHVCVNKPIPHPHPGCKRYIRTDICMPTPFVHCATLTNISISRKRTKIVCSPRHQRKGTCCCTQLLASEFLRSFAPSVQ